MRVIKSFVIFFWLSILPVSGIAMSLQDAERLALERDTIIKSIDQQALAFAEKSRSVEAWPDPRIKLGVQAVPVGSFDLEQEPMTQIVLGYQQMLPRGNSLTYASESMNAMSRMQTAKSAMRKREVLKHVRQAWLDVVFHNESIRIIQANRLLFSKMLDITQSYYAAGRQQQQDVVQAELEISLVDDRLEQALSKRIVAKANLAKWIGEENMDDALFVDKKLKIKDLPEIHLLSSTLQKNPELIAANERIVSQQKKLDMAEEQYKPQWGFDINYGQRSGNNPDGSERDDFVSAMVTLDLPLFTDNKQDRTVSAERQRLQAARYKQQDVNRMLVKRLNVINARLQKLDDRYQLYQEKVLAQAHQNSEVSLKGYQSGVVSFFTLTRARITELNTRLANLRIKVDYNKAYAELQYLIGGKK